MDHGTGTEEFTTTGHIRRTQHSGTGGIGKWEIVPFVCASATEHECARDHVCGADVGFSKQKVVLTFEVLSDFGIHRKEGYWAIITLI